MLANIFERGKTIKSARIGEKSLHKRLPDRFWGYQAEVAESM